MALPSIGSLWTLARKVEDLLALQTKVRESLVVIDERLKALENRMTKLEAEQTQIITEARSASTAAATMIVGNVISDTVTRITRLEGRTDQFEGRRVPPPPS
jgi:phage shock protein A